MLEKRDDAQIVAENMTSSVINFNVGILGHVDSGKTSLAKALSSVSSTAAFDKNPQSQERGITLDLGFSSFTVEKDDKLIQYTLVDCPGTTFFTFIDTNP